MICRATELDLARVRERAFVILNPDQITRVEIAAAKFASKIMICVANAPPVGALAEHGPARPRFIDRHDRRHLADPSQKTLDVSNIAQRTPAKGASNRDCREAIPNLHALDAPSRH
jgi:hypothetical protein